jgi:hypothetical protein
MDVRRKAEMKPVKAGAKDFRVFGAIGWLKPDPERATAR